MFEEISEGIYVCDHTKRITGDIAGLHMPIFYIMPAGDSKEGREIASRMVVAAMDLGRWVGVSYLAFKMSLIEDMKRLINLEMQGTRERPFSEIVKLMYMSLSPEGALQEIADHIQHMNGQGWIELQEKDRQMILLPTQKLADLAYRARE